MMGHRQVERTAAGFQHEAIACAFDLLRLDGDDLRRLPLSERKAKLRKLLPRSADGMQYCSGSETW